MTDCIYTMFRRKELASEVTLFDLDDSRKMGERILEKAANEGHGGDTFPEFCENQTTPRPARPTLEIEMSKRFSPSCKKFQREGASHSA
jgi:hypothetical protein